MLAAWIDGRRGESLPLADRALHYGDAAFTTIRVHAQSACWIELHLARLHDACVRLQLPMPDWTALEAEIAKAANCARAGVVKVLLSRGDGVRGYSPVGTRGRRIVFVYALPAVDANVYINGIALRVATLRLSSQPLLAGIKHANRLEQVLARAEWADPEIGEALLLDADDNVISATAANVFARFGSEIRTPVLDCSGVAGVCRQKVMDSSPPGFSVTVGCMRYDDLAAADELFLSNAVRGIVPVRALGDHRYGASSAAHWLMGNLHPAIGLPLPLDTRDLL